MQSVLLRQFEETFRGHAYRHRVSTVGDALASTFYEDLLEYCVETGDGGAYAERVQSGAVVLNTLNRVTGRRGRRADGTLGARVPSEIAEWMPERRVARAPVATLQIGIEFKILATKLTAQMDRVATDLRNQAEELTQINPEAITMAFVGVNHAHAYEGYEGTRTFRAKRAPAAEAEAACQFIYGRVRASYDELLVLRFSATNIEPFPFDWVDAAVTRREYSAAVLRAGELYRRRFA